MPEKYIILSLVLQDRASDERESSKYLAQFLQVWSVISPRAETRSSEKQMPMWLTWAGTLLGDMVMQTKTGRGQGELIEALNRIASLTPKEGGRRERKIDTAQTAPRSQHVQGSLRWVLEPVDQSPKIVSTSVLPMCLVMGWKWPEKCFLGTHTIVRFRLQHEGPPTHLMQLCRQNEGVNTFLSPTWTR